MFRLRLLEKQAGLSAGLGGFGWCKQKNEMRFAWARRRFGAGLARVWCGFGRVWCEYGACFVWPGAYLVRVGCFWLRLGCSGFEWVRLVRAEDESAFCVALAQVRSGLGAGLGGFGRVWFGDATDRKAHRIFGAAKARAAPKAAPVAPSSAARSPGPVGHPPAESCRRLHGEEWWSRMLTDLRGARDVELASYCMDEDALFTQLERGTQQ